MIPLLICNLNLRLSPLSSVPRNHDHNTVLGIDFDIELGNTADEAKDDPGKYNTFDRDSQALLMADCRAQMMTDEPHFLRAK